MLSPDTEECMKKLRMKYVFNTKTAAFYTPFSYLPIHEDDTIERCATDGRQIFVNRDFFINLDFIEALGALFHEYIHNVLGHTSSDFPKVTHQSVLTRAQEIAVNNIVLDCGLELPENVIIDRSYAGWSTLAIYRDLVDKGHTNDNTDGGCGCAKVYVVDPKDSDKDLPDPLDQNDVLRKLSQIKAGLGDITGTNLTKAIGELIDAAATPVIDWDDELLDSSRRIFDGTSPDYSRPIPQYMPKIFIPGYKEDVIENLFCGLDVSYSCTLEELGKAQAVLNELRSMYNIETVTIITYNHDIIDRVDFAEYDEINICDMEGDGGTRGDAVFEYIKKHGEEPHALLMISDTEDNITTKSKDINYPVIWLNTSHDKAFKYYGEPDFGKIINI